MLKCKCVSCGKKYTPDHDEAIVHVYKKAKYNHVETFCPHCMQGFFLFFGDDPVFVHLGYPVEVHERPDSAVRSVWRQMEGLEEAEEPTPDELLDDFMVARFHSWLEDIEPADFTTSA